MGLCHFLGRVLLVVINLILVIVSISLITLGFLIKLSPSTFNTYTEPVREKIVESVNSAFDNTNFTFDDFELADVFGRTATVLVAIGFVLLIISCFGACGACCDMKCMLMSYAMILILLVIAQTAFCVLVTRYPEHTKDLMYNPMYKLMEKFQGLNGTNVESMVWNFVMIEFECCGLDDALDFKDGVTGWFGEDATDWNTPVACCKTLPSATNDFSCAKQNGFDPDLNNFNKGCIDEIWNFLTKENKTYTYLGVGGIIGFQVLMVIFALVLFCQEDQKVAPSEVKQINHRRYDPRGRW